MMATKPRYRREAALKVLERVITHSAFASMPVRFRCDPNLTVPVFRCSRYGLSVWLPSNLARYIPLLAAFVRSFRCKQTVTIVVRSSQSRPKLSQPKLKAKAKTKTKFVPNWQREWDALWDEVAQKLFGNRETRDAN